LPARAAVSGWGVIATSLVRKTPEAAPSCAVPLVLAYGYGSNSGRCLRGAGDGEPPVDLFVPWLDMGAGLHPPTPNSGAVLWCTLADRTALAEVELLADLAATIARRGGPIKGAAVDTTTLTGGRVSACVRRCLCRWPPAL
jgi:hypothetical protein